jgi:ribosomal protein L7/L12
MSPLVKLLLLVVIAVAIWYVVTRIRAAQQTPVAFTPVEELPDEARNAVDAALARGEVVAAIKHYRAATGAGLMASKAAIDVRKWKQGA